MKKYKLSQSTIEKLEHYVYLLINPRNDKVFYVGKGKGNRINQHLLGVLDKKNKEKNTIKRIREIQNENFKVKTTILRHGLSEKEALKLESAVIDLLGKENLTNIVKGYHSKDRGIMSLSDIKIKYEAEEAIIEEPVILININRRYQKNMKPEEIYEATRKHWKISMRRASRVKIACSVFRGIIREVFIIDRWLPSPAPEEKRHMFEGEVAPKDVKAKYINKSVVKYWKRGSQNPIKYINA